MNTRPQLSEITQEVIDGWKKKHGKLFCFNSQDGKAKGYFRSPDRKEMDAYSVMQKNNPVLCNEMLLKQVFLGGDELLLTDDSYFYGVSQKLQALIDTKQGELTEI